MSFITAGISLRSLIEVANVEATLTAPGRARAIRAQAGQGQCLAMLVDSALDTWGTKEDLWLHFSRALIARGVRPVLVFSQASVGHLRWRYEAEGIEVAVINYGKGALHYYRELGKIVKAHSVTAVHIAFFNHLSLIPWIARLCGLRSIVFHERTSVLWRARSLKKFLLCLRTRIVTHPITQVVAVSGHAKSQLIHAGVPQTKVVVVYNGVHPGRFVPDPKAREDWAQRFEIRSDELIVTSIAHMRPFKHPEVIVEAFALLAQRGVKARLFMAGGGTMQPELEDLSRKLGVSQHIHWLGSHGDPASLLQATDIFVLASVGEAFGLVLAEAMASGVPVVGSRSGAIPEVVEDGRTGLLARPLDPASFADAIERLAGDAALRHEMGRRGLKRVRQHFTVEASIEKLVEAYESVWSQ
jgi:glycosyltransferase involved in cell wall biosynthesis